MSNPTRVLALSEVRLGMALADDLRDERGTMLLPRGTVIDDASILSLRYWAIDRIAVLDEDGSEPDGAARQQHYQARLDTLFRKCRGQQASDALLLIVQRYRQGAPE